jgi:hypothetical protein
VIGSGLSGIAGMIEGITGAISGVISAISDVIGWFGKLISKAGEATSAAGAVPGGVMVMPSASSQSVVAWSAMPSAAVASASAHGASGRVAVTISPHNYYVTVHDAYDPDKVGRTLVDILNRYERRRGGVSVGGPRGLAFGGAV